uniref:Ribosomal protein S15 n=1 Tax=Romanomermis culicivorax TaxID=13658 RepID=A0A915HYG4_ROMCU
MRPQPMGWCPKWASNEFISSFLPLSKLLKLHKKWKEREQKNVLISNQRGLSPEYNECLTLKAVVTCIQTEECQKRTKPRFTNITRLQTKMRHVHIKRERRVQKNSLARVLMSKNYYYHDYGTISKVLKKH